MRKLLLLLLLAALPAAQAQHREIARERFRTQHWVFDDRFHHNHYYPALGYSIAVLPAGNIAVNFRGGRYWFQSGVWFEQDGPRYVVVKPPPGIVVPVLPPGYTTVFMAGAPYYYANDVYYGGAPGGYAVVNPPAAEAAPPPPPAPQAPQAASWYYCESSKAYYPYVSECKEGWKQVPATPPK